MADEEIRIDYITTYITNKHGDYLRKSDQFNKSLRENAYVTKKGEASLASWRKELERTSPEIAQATADLDRLHKMEARGIKLNEQQRHERQRLIGVLKNERLEIRNTIRDREKDERSINSNVRAVENLISRIDNLGDAHLRNTRKHSIWQRKIDDITLRSTRRAISGVHEWTTTLASMALPAVPQFLSLLSGAIMTVGTAAVGAASSLAKLGPGIGAVGGAVLGVVQAMGVWKLAMRDMDKLISSAMFDNLADFTKKLEKFTPAAQEFAVTMRMKVKPALTEWQKIAQGNIFGGINRGVNALLPRRGLVTDIVRQTSEALGQGIGNFGVELGKPEWAKAFRDIGTSNAQNIRVLTAAAIPLAQALRDIVVAGQPILDWATQATARTAKLFNQWIQGKKATGELAAGVKGAQERLRDFVDIGASWGSTALSILKAGQSTGDMITKGLRDNANAMQEWSKSFEGQRRMTEFFLNLQPAVKESGLLIRDLGKALAQTAEQSSIDLLIHQLRADLLPTLTQTMIQVNQNMGPLLVETFVNILQAFTVAMGPNGPVSLLINGVNQLAQAFTKLTQLPVLGTLTKWTIGLTALWRVARLTGAVVGARVLTDVFRGRTARADLLAQRGQMQASIMGQLPAAFPQAFVQQRNAQGQFTGKRLDMSLLPPHVQQALAPVPPTFMERVRSGQLRQDFNDLRLRGQSRLGAGFTAIRPNLVGGGSGLVTGGAILGGLVASQAAGAAGASSRTQNIIGLASAGAGIGAMAGAPFGGVGAPIGAVIGGLAGGLAGLGVSFLSAKPKVDEFGNSLQKATVGLAATREVVSTMNQNQRQLQLGVRSGQLELRAAVRARDALTKGMTDREFQKFAQTDVFKQAQLRVDTARTNLKDMQDALDKNTEQLRIANQRLKQDTQRPRQLLQRVAGEFGGKLSDVNENIRNVREGGVTQLERRRLNQLLDQRRKIISDFATQMTRAAKSAAENGQPFFARMFGNALAKAVNDGRIQAGFTRAVLNATRRGIVLNTPGGRASPSSHDAPGQVRGRMGGGRITWGNATSDSAPAMLSRGEFVVTGGGEQMLESMTFPGVLDWLEGSQPPHFRKGGRIQRFLRGGRVKGMGDLIDRRRDDIGRPRGMRASYWGGEKSTGSDWEWFGSVGPFMGDLLQPDPETPLPLLAFAARAAMMRDKPFKVVKFPENSELGKLQKAMGVHNFRRGGRFQDGGFFRKAVLSQFRGSFSSGFSAGESKTPDAIAGLFASTVQAGQFAAEPPPGSDKKSKGHSEALQKASPKVRALDKLIAGMIGKIPFVPGGGHGTAPGPSKPTISALMNMGMSHAQARINAAEGKAGLDYTGFVRYALARGGFGDPGRLGTMLLNAGKTGAGNYLTVIVDPGGKKAYLRVAGADYGYFGRSPSTTTLDSRSRVSRPGFNQRHFGNYRRGGRVRGFATGGRMPRFRSTPNVIALPNLSGTGGVSTPGLSGAGGDAANRQWALGVSSYLQSLTTASIGNITSAINSLGSQVVSMTANADSSPAAQNLLARVSALLDAAEFALGERLGRAQAAIEDMATETARRRTRLDRFQRQHEIDTGGVLGLRQELGQLRFENFGRLGLRAQIRAQRGLVAQAAGTDEEQQLRDKLESLIDEAAENLTQRVITRRAIARARAQAPVDRLGQVIDTRNFDLQRLTLRQQIAGISDTPAGNTQLDTFLKNQLLPAQIAREKAAHRAMVQERRRSGDKSEAFQQAQQQWQQAVLDRLGTQNEIAQDTKDATEKVARVLGGQLSFDFNGQQFTDVITSGVGA